MRGRLWPVLCARWRLSTALFRWMPDRFPFSVPGGLFVRRPSFPFRFRPSLPGLLFRIVVSLVFGQPVGATSFPCLPGFHLNIYEVFSCVASCASSVLSLCVSSVPVSSPFCNPCRPLHFSVPIRPVAPMRLPYFSLCVSSVQLYPSFLSRYLLLFYSLCPSLLSFLCVRLLTHALYFPCVPFVPVLLPLCRPFCPSFSVLGLSVPLVRVFSLVAPTFPVPFPLFPAAFPSSSSFVPAFSFPFSPLFSSPSFSIKKKVPS